MGIRFFCPKGHKLNVKEFQAGRTGICPFCSEKVRIPLESTRPSSKEKAGNGELATGKEVEEAEPAGEVIALELLPVTAAVAEAPVATGGAAEAMADPLAEGGEVVWYVRPASGGQYGPATPEVMRNWLGEGRIGVDSLVWREGWREWRSGGEVFPQLATQPAMAGLDFVVTKPVAADVRPNTPPPRDPARVRNTRLIVIGSLAVVVFVLCVILLVVVLKQ